MIGALLLTFYFLSTFSVAYLFLLTFKSIQRRVFVGLKPLKRKPQFATFFIYPNCQKKALLLLTSNYIMKLSFLLFHLKKTTMFVRFTTSTNIRCRLVFAFLRSNINNCPLAFLISCTKISHTLFSALKALYNPVVTCSLLFNLERTDTQLLSSTSAFRQNCLC